MFYNREFELDLVAYSLKKPLYFRQHLHRLKKLKFQDKLIDLVFQNVVRCLIDYKTLPTQTELEKIVEETIQENPKMNDLERETAAEIVSDVFTRQTTDLTGVSITNYLVEHEKNQIADELKSSNPEKLLDNLEELERRLSKLKHYAHDDEDLGLNLLSDEGIAEAKKLLNEYNTASCIPTGYPVLDQQLSGGLRKGELVVIMASTGVGKTSLLLNLTVNLVKQGNRMVYIVLDNIEGDIISRTAGCLLNTDITKGIDPGIAFDEVSYAFQEKHKNKLWFKHFNPRELTKSKLERYLEKLKLYLYEIDKAAGVPEEERGLIDGVAIDYMELMIPESSAEEGWAACEHLAQEIKSVLKTNNLLGLTATQGNTEAMKADTLKLHMGAGYKARFNAPDIIFGVSQDDSEKNSIPSQFRLGCLKARRAKNNYQIKFTFWKEKQVIREAENAKVYNMSDKCLLEDNSREVSSVDHRSRFSVKNKGLLGSLESHLGGNPSAETNNLGDEDCTQA